MTVITVKQPVTRVDVRPGSGGAPGPKGDPGPGVPAGGSDGDVMVKDGSDPYDFTTVGKGTFVETVAAAEAVAKAGTSTSTVVTPLGARQILPFFPTRYYEPDEDGIVDVSTALQDALDDAGALVGPATVDAGVEVLMSAGAQYKADGLVIPGHVRLMAANCRITAAGAGTIVTLDGHKAEICDAILIGGGAGVAVVGVEVLTGTKCAVRRCHFDQLAGQAIKVRSGATWIEDCFAQNCLLDDSVLSVPTGVLDVNATDVFVSGCEFTASQSSLSSGGFAYAVSLRGANHHIESVIAEISDHGWYIAATDVHITTSRADLNRGHGWVIAAGSSGEMSVCAAINNGRETTNTYDGFNFANTSRWVVDVCRAIITTGNTHRYGFEDATSSASVFNQFGSSCKSIGHGTAAIHVGNFAGSRVACVDGPFLDVAAAATTLNVQLRDWPSCRWNLKSVAPVTFTSFTNGVTGQRLLVMGDGQTTFDHNVSLIRCKSGADTLAAANTIYEFVFHNSGVWYEI